MKTVFLIVRFISFVLLLVIVGLPTGTFLYLAGLLLLLVVTGVLIVLYYAWAYVLIGLLLIFLSPLAIAFFKAAFANDSESLRQFARKYVKTCWTLLGDCARLPFQLAKVLFEGVRDAFLAGWRWVKAGGEWR